MINVEYTANMENTLDEIAEGQIDPIAYMHTFYDEFAPLVQSAYEKMPKKRLERVGRTCRNVVVNLSIVTENMASLFLVSTFQNVAIQK